MTRPLIATFCLAAVLLAPAQVHAQEGVPGQSEVEKDAEYNRLFVAGLQALTARQIERSIQLFSACVRLYPDRPTAYYNIACAYSQGGDTAKAVAQLRAAFERGFHDLAHMGRDPDLDPIRRTPEYRQALGEFERALRSSVEPAISVAPAAEGAFPVLIYLHDQRGRPDKVLDDLKAALPEWGIVLPKGPAVPNQPGTYYWDDRAEFLALSCVRDYLDANPSADRRQVYLVGDGGAAALAVSIAGHNPDVFTGVAAAGSNLNAGTQEVDLSGLRAYLIVDQSEGDDVEAGMEARDAFTQAGSPVVLERYPRDPAVASDRALLLRALTWLQGKPTPLPGAGDDRWF